MKNLLTLFRMSLYEAAYELVVKKAFSLKFVTQILQWWNLVLLYLTWKVSKKYKNHVSHPLSSTDISIFSLKISIFYYIKNADLDILHMHFNT